MHFGGDGGCFVFNNQRDREEKRGVLLNVSCESVVRIRGQKFLIT